jgi:uncharacterized protein YbbC (DUF1343 family)
LVPEHGFFTSVRAGVAVHDEQYKGIEVISLYGKNRKPTKEMLNGCDAVIVDIQDIGVRSYTYISSLTETMEACAENGKKIIILDRPNPIGGLIVDGNVPDEGKESFVCRIPVPYLHGLTIAEIAKMVKGENWINKAGSLDLEVVKMANWERWMHYEDTGLPWFPTSPHVPTVNSIRGLATLGVFGELGLVSIGIGTTLPFQYIGHPSLSNSSTDYEAVEGVRYFRNRYQPFYGMYNGKDVPGYILDFSPDNQSKYFSSGMKIFRKLSEKSPELLSSIDASSNGAKMFVKTTGTDDYLQMFKSREFDKLDEKLQEGVIEFLVKREQYLLYK